ncbi:hypothetical protein FQA47_002497 [Oryzias melastigma]|uniref:Uncharacterized protein n=1 Tax=Oryzias melastigma TaxID=30732 RepID=A0A834CHU3_ORYME|nr:hypothetical protein FQA47_002497 [Oryzias melastigma]
MKVKDQLKGEPPICDDCWYNICGRTFIITVWTLLNTVLSSQVFRLKVFLIAVDRSCNGKTKKDLWLSWTNMPTIPDPSDVMIIPIKTYALQLAKFSGKEDVEKQLNLNKILSSLENVAASVTNKNQLEVFQEFFHRLADIVEMKKVEEWQHSLMEAKKMNEQVMAIQKRMKKEMKETTKRLPFKVDVMFYNLIYNLMRCTEELKMLFDLRTWSYTAEAEDIERKLENYYISEFKHEIHGDLDFYASENQDELHDEL